MAFNFSQDSDLNEEIRQMNSTLAYLRILTAAVKANFNPLQPRDSDGKWTVSGASDQGLTDVSAARRIVSIDSSGAMTGISTIDETTTSLCETLSRTMEAVEFIPEWTPQIYGTAVHVAFGTAVRLGGFDGIGFSDVEHSFFEGDDATYGQQGSIRTDVLLRNDIGDIIAIYDVKTGQGGLSRSRVQEIRDHVGVQSDVPIIELHVLRGARLKTRAALIIGYVMARLYRPERQ